MKIFKKGLSMAISVIMAAQTFVFVPSAGAYESEDFVSLGEAVYTYNINGDVAAVNDGDSDTKLEYDRSKYSNDTWMSAIVYDAGEGNTYEFNRIRLQGKGVRFYGAHEEGNLLDIAGTIDTTSGINYSENDNLDFVDQFGVEPIWHPSNGNYYGDVTYDSETDISYRYIVLVITEGWKNAQVNEVTFSKVSYGATVTFDGDMTVTEGLNVLTSGDSVPEGAELVFTPTLGDGDELQYILVNGEPIDGDTYVVGREDIEVSFALVEKRTVTFGEDVKVSADGTPIESGTQLSAGAVLTIEPVLAEGDVLAAILVNGEAIDGDSYTVTSKNVEITLSLAEKRTVTFGEKISVSVDGVEIESGSAVSESKELVISVALGDSEQLDSISINGAAISAPYTYTVGGEDIEITAAIIEKIPVDPEYKTELGAPVIVYNSRGGDPSLMTDGDANTAYVSARNNLAPTYAVACVYDAGENNFFQFNRVTVTSATGVYIYGTNELGALADIAGTIEAKDYSQDINLFAETFTLDALATLTNSYESFADTCEYRYVVVFPYGGWPILKVSEVELSLLSAEELLEDRTVTFGENIKVSVDGTEITSGSTVKETKVLEITPVLQSGEVLNTIRINGTPIEGTTYTVGGEDITVDFTIVEDRTVTFGSDVSVSVDGTAIAGGSKVLDGKTITITPTIPDNAVLGSITVNGAAIEGNTYTIAGEDITVAFTVIYKRSVTFGSDVTVTADGAAVVSGDMLLEGTVIEITPVLQDGEILDQILVNGEAIGGTSYTLGGADAEITIKIAAVDPDAISLGAPVYVYNLPSGDASLMTDGLSSTSLSFSRTKTGPTWITAVVYDAGEGKSFDFRTVMVEGSSINVFGSNSAANDTNSILDIASTIDTGTDWSVNLPLFAENYGLTSLGTATQAQPLSFEGVQSYRYITVVMTEGWAANTVISEITLSNKITVVAAEMGEVIYAGGEYTSKSGRWAQSNFSGTWTAGDSDFGIVNGAAYNHILWGYVGGNDPQATDYAGVVTFKLVSEADTYADIKIIGTANRDERDFTVWVEGENGETSQGTVLTLNAGTDMGGLYLYVVKNVQVFKGINKITIGSSQFGYSPDFVMSVFVDKSDSVIEVGEIKEADGNEYNFGTLVKSDSLIQEFFPDINAGDELGVLPIANKISVEVISDGGSYNLIVLADKSDITVAMDDTLLSADFITDDYSDGGGLYGAIVKGVTLADGITSLTVTGSDITGIKLVPVRSNTITFGEEITVVAGGKIVNSGDSVTDGTFISITPYSPDNLMVDRILVNEKEIEGTTYLVYNEDISVRAEFTDVFMVSVTFGDNVIVRLADTNEIIQSGDLVRGDASLRFSSPASAGISAVYSVNGTAISGSTYTLSKQGIHVTVELIPEDLKFLENYEITLLDETETALRYLLPKAGEYGSEITWALADDSKGDTIEAYDSENLVLSVEMAANGYEARAVALTAKITVMGEECTVEKSVYAETNTFQSIGGRDFYIRPIGSTVADYKFANGQFALSGKGGDLWQAPDSFGYLYTKTSDTDFTISARIDKIEGYNQWRRTGLMLRESTAEGARLVMLSIGANNGAGLEFASRSDNNGRALELYRDTSYVNGKSSYYLKLEKLGDYINAYSSEDGVTYTKINSEPISFEFEDGYLAGLFSESETGYTYFSRFEINGRDVLVADGIENAAYAPSDGKIKVTWSDPEEYSSFSFESVAVTADCGDGNPVTVEVPKGAQEAVLAGLTNGSEYTVTIQAKTGELCGEEVNNASAYNAVGKGTEIKAMPFNAAEYAAKAPELELSFGDTVMVGERNRLTLAFKETQPLNAFEISFSLPEGVSVDNSATSLIDGCVLSENNSIVTLSYSGNGIVREIGTVALLAANTGSYTVELYGSATYYSFESGSLETERTKLASAEVEVIDVHYVTLTFDGGITVTIDGEAVASGSVVRGDSELYLDCSVPENAEIVYTVNGIETTESIIVLNKEDTHISYEVTPFDIKYLRELDIVQRTETEAGVIFDLPAQGEYGSDITWSLKDTSTGDSVAKEDYDTWTLVANMKDNNYVSRDITLTASIKFGGKVYTVEKTLRANTNILHELGGMNFFLRQIGQDDQSTANVQIENHQIALTGYGTDLWTTPDSFGYFYTKSSDSNFTISAKIDLQQGSNTWRRSGLMFRQSDSETEKMVMLDVGASNGAALEFAYRVGTTGGSNQVTRDYSHANNIYLMLEKKGNKFYAYYSDDGEEFTLLTEVSATVTMNGEYLVGIFSETETGTTYFSRLEINGDDVFVSNDITNAAATPSEGKIKVSWEDPLESGSRTYKDILVTVTDGRRTHSVAVAKGVGETVVENLTNGVMYTVTVQARTAELCTQSTEYGASSYNALSAPITMEAFPVNISYLAGTNPVISMDAAPSVAVGQANKVELEFESVQPVYALDLAIEIPENISVRESDVTLSDALKEAGAKVDVKNGKLTITYSAENSDGVVYVSEIAAIKFSGAKRGEYEIKAEGSISYYSYEIGELSTEISSDSSVTFEVKGTGSSSSSGGGGSSSGGSSGTYIPYVEGVKLEPTPDATSVYIDAADIPSWATESVGRLTQRGIVNGIESAEGLMFLPNSDVTREQFVKLCVTAFMKLDASAVCSFTDVAEGEWYYPYIATMVQAGIINGRGDGSFGVGDSITRQDMAVILYKLFNAGYINLASGPVTSFSDSDRIADYAREAVSVLRAAGVINGYENNIYAPEANVTRAQAAKVIFGCMN